MDSNEGFNRTIKDLKIKKYIVLIMGRPKNIHTPIKHFTEEDRKKAITQSKTKYMLNKEWSMSCL